MRQIKFRGKRADNREWVYGNYIEKISPSKKEPTFWASLIHDRALTTYKAIPETVGQFTGLTDKNGKEIFEGDILGVDDKAIGHIVGNVRGYCYDVVYAQPLENGEKSWTLYGIVEKDYKDRIIVIGNIHDNPELLKPTGQ